MAFDRTKFGPIGGQSSRGKAPQLWSYQSTDAATVVRFVSYFDDVSDILEVGDAILAHLDTGGTPQSYLFTVNANSGGVVDVHDGLAFGTTDTD